MGEVYICFFKTNKLARNSFLAKSIIISITFGLILTGYQTESVRSKKDLGKKLFFEKRLSKNNKISCASCHIPEFAFADTLPVSIGVQARRGLRNTPSVMNMASREIFFYDGRAATLEEQATFPIQDHNEMDILLKEAFQKIRNDKTYRVYFKKIYHQEPNRSNILESIAEFERTLESSSPFDDYMNGDTNAISASQKRGHKLFVAKENRCFECHFSPDFTADEFKNVGLFDGIKYNDSGRYRVTKKQEDIGKFKVPGLRNVAVTMPYMHDGSFKTLREVITYYKDIHKVIKNPLNVDTLVQTPINLTEQDVNDIENFLISLTDKRFNKIVYEKYPHHRRRN